MFGWHSTSGPLVNANFHAGVYFDGGAIKLTHLTSTIVYSGIPFAAQTFDEMAVVLGGYDVNGVPWDNSQPVAGFEYGYAVFIKWTGTWDTWTLLYRSDLLNTDPMYPALNVRYPDAARGGIRMDNIRVPVNNYKAVLSIANWIEQNGDWQITGNRAVNVGAGPGTPFWIATIATGLSDAFLRSIVRVPSVSGGIIFRYTDNDNLWLLRVSATTGNLELYERNAAVWTLRANVGAGIAINTDYEVTAVFDGTALTGYVDGGNKIAFVSAFNQAATVCGYQTGNAANFQFDNFHIQPRDEYSALDLCP
jgi:hypothetical protein